MEVLIVDDDGARAESIGKWLSEIRPDCKTTFSDSVNGAKRELRAAYFDLLIVDLVLPINNLAPKPSRTGGLSLLEWLEDDGLKPGYVIGISSFSDIADQQAADFSERAWVVVRHDPFESTWKAQLSALVTHIANSKQHASTLKYESDLLLITALRKPELDEVLALGWQFDSILTPIPGRQFVRKGSIRVGEKQIIVHAGATSKMGMVWTSLFVASAVRKLRPRVVAMTGICMGHPTETKLGDIVVALHSWNWQAGRLSALQDGSAVFEPQPEPIVASRALTNLWDELSADARVAQEIYDGFKGIKPDKPPKIKVAPMVSGSVVVAHKSVHNDIFNQDRKIRAVDMETFGVFAGCDAEDALPPLFLSIKAVSDLGLPDKGDSFQNYCAYASAKALEIFLDRFWNSNITPLFNK